jgi:hypothetical protein
MTAIIALAIIAAIIGNAAITETLNPAPYQLEEETI